MAGLGGAPPRHYGVGVQSRQRYQRRPRAERRAAFMAPRDPYWQEQEAPKALNQLVVLVCRDIAVGSGSELAAALDAQASGAAGAGGWCISLNRVSERAQVGPSGHRCPSGMNPMWP